MRVALDDTDNDEFGLVIYQGEPVTGIVIESHPDGSVQSETEYVNGVPDGVERDYRPNGELEAERIFKTGLIVESREWYPNGRLAHDARYVDGHKVEEHRWDDSGTEI